MIQEFVDIFQRHKGELSWDEHPSWEAIITDTLELINNNWDEEQGLRFKEKPNTNRIHLINDGDYQGSLLFLVPAGEYQPCSYYAVMVSYGTCSGCDTLLQISGEFYDANEKPNEEQQKDYRNLALNVVQWLQVVA